MKNFIFIIAIAFFYVFNGCYKCKNIEYCPLPASALEYFGAYTEGAYWIYFNHDSTKTDSVYITDFEMKREGYNTGPCMEWDAKTFLLQSEFLSHKTIEAKTTIGDDCDKSHTTFLIRESYRVCIANDKEMVLLDGCGTTQDIKLIETYHLDNGTNKSYNNVIQCDSRFWFAPEVGLIKYLSYDNIDTFYLNQYKVI